MTLAIQPGHRATALVRRAVDCSSVECSYCFLMKKFVDGNLITSSSLSPLTHFISARIVPAFHRQRRFVQSSSALFSCVDSTTNTRDMHMLHTTPSQLNHCLCFPLSLSSPTLTTLNYIHAKQPIYQQLEAAEPHQASVLAALQCVCSLVCLSIIHRQIFLLTFSTPSPPFLSLSPPSLPTAI